MPSQHFVISTAICYPCNLLSSLLRLTSASKKHTIHHQMYGLHPRAHDVYNVGNILLMLTSVVFAMLTGYSVTCTHHAHTLAHPRPRAEERGRKKGEGVEELPCTHTHARTIAPEPPKGGGNISIYIYRPKQTQSAPKAFMHKYT